LDGSGSGGSIGRLKFKQSVKPVGVKRVKSIFVVDDSSTMVMSLKSTLEISGFKVDTASDGEQALGKIKAGLKPDLIITDINMPKMDGLMLIKEARKILRFTPILALTTESQQGKRDEAKKLGATGWLVKPVSGTDLVKVVKQVVPGA
jgi:two-component system, chemotaxis family, chemotaxis protein CheY